MMVSSIMKMHWSLADSCEMSDPSQNVIDEVRIDSIIDKTVLSVLQQVELITLSYEANCHLHISGTVTDSFLETFID